MRSLRAVWVVVLLIGGSACASGASTTSTSATPGSTTAAIPVPSSTTVVETTTTSDALNLSAFEWTRVSFETQGDVAQWMTGVAVLEGKVIAVGTEMSAGDADAAVWVSADGLTWSRVPHDEVVFGGDGMQTMTAVTAFDGGVVAVGRDGNDNAVWVSPDGVSWSRVRDDAALQETEFVEFFAVAPLGGGVIAVGATAGEPSLVGNTDPAVWVSGDGYSWTRVVSSALKSEATEWMRGVAPGESVTVAVGLAHNVADVDGAVWISSDGYTWTRIEQPALGGPGRQLIFDVAQDGTGFVAVGLSGSRAAVWTSPDGVSWIRIGDDPTVFGSSAQEKLRIAAVVVLEGGFVAVGRVEKPDDLGDAAVWISEDGATWTRIQDEGLLGGPGGQALTAVVAFEGGLVAVGNGGEGTIPTPGVWLARPPDG